MARAQLPSAGELLRAVVWVLPFFGALLPIVFLSIHAVRVSTEATTRAQQATNAAAAAQVSTFVSQDLTMVLGATQAMAGVPGTAAALTTDNDVDMRLRLRTLALAFPQIEQAAALRGDGMPWVAFPPTASGFTLSATELALLQNGQSTMGAIRQNAGGESPTVSLTAPITQSGVLLGAITTDYRTSLLTRWLKSLTVGAEGFAVVLDQNGTVVAHPFLPSSSGASLAFASLPRPGSGTTLESTMTDPFSQVRMTALAAPFDLAGQRWTVLVLQPVDELSAALRPVIVSLVVAGGILTLVTLAMVIMLAALRRRNERISAELARKNDTLRDISSFVSHQLRAPVTSMQLVLQSILDGDFGELTADLQEQLTQLRGVAVQNGQLIDDILNVSRIDRGVVEVQVAPVPLKDIAERALRDYRLPLKNANLSLTTVGFDLAITVLADAEKMAESVTNAISNAIKHTKQGGLTVTVRQDGTYGYIDVTDTGEGMPPEMIQKLFSRTGVKGSNAKAATSTGLGLFIARNFMQLQQGDIIVTSTVGQGSTFSYKIPLNQGGQLPPAQAA